MSPAEVLCVSVERMQSLLGFLTISLTVIMRVFASLLEGMNSQLWANAEWGSVNKRREIYLVLSEGKMISHDAVWENVTSF